MSHPWSGSSRLLAALMAWALVAAALPLPPSVAAAADPPSSLSGRIFRSDGRTPVKDAVVKAFNHRTERLFQSTASGADGSYRVEGLEPGEYDLGVSTSEGTYLVEARLNVAPGQLRAASFALQPEVEAAGAGSQGEPAAQQADTKKPQKPRKLRAGSGAGGGSISALAAAGIIVGGALVVGALANSLADDDDGDSDGSPN